MCHWGLVGSTNPHPSIFRTTRVAAATLRPPLPPLVAQLNEYCNLNLHHGSYGIASRLYAHWRDGAPMALIVCGGSFGGGAFWVQSGGPLNTSLGDKKRHTRVHKGAKVVGWACKATPQASVLFNTRALHALLPWEGE